MVGPLRVVSVTVTRRRAPLVKRLIDSIKQAGPEIAEIIVVADGHDPATETVVRESGAPARYVVSASAGGTGVGMNVGLEIALQNPLTSHCLTLDDDALVPPGAIRSLTATMRELDAGCAVPLIEDQNGEIGWFPGVTQAKCRTVLKQPRLTRAQFLEACGDAPVPFTWAPWGFLLASAVALRSVGLPRTDFGFGGDDLEWALRISARFPSFLVPQARGWHWPPPRQRGPEAYDIDCLQLQNLCLLATRLPHGRRAARHIPGAVWRFGKRWGWHRPQTLADVARAFGLGAILNRPALAHGGGMFWQRFVAHRPA